MRAQGITEPAMARALETAVPRMCAAAMAGLAAEPANQELARCLFDMGHTLLMFAPELLCGSQALPPLFRTAVSCMRLRELDPVRSAVKFVSVLLHPGDKARASATWQRCRGAVDHCVGQVSERGRRRVFSERGLRIFSLP